MTSTEIRKSPSGKEVSLENLPPGSSVGDMLYWDGSEWVPLSPPSTGSLLAFDSPSGQPLWIEGSQPGQFLYYDGLDWQLVAQGSDGAMLQQASGAPTWTSPGTETNAWMVYDSTTGLWVPNTLRERVFDNTYNPAGNWGLNLQTLADSSGNGFTLTATGTERYTYATRTLGAARLASTQLSIAGSQPLLGPTGACSFLALCIITALPSNQSLIAGYTVTGETEADNAQWALFLDPDGTIVYTQENGAGVNSSHTVNSWATVGQLAMIGFTKTSGQQVQHYLNGRTWGSLSAPLTAPTGGSSARFRVGNDGGANFNTMTICSMAFYNSTLTAAQVAERFNYALGRSAGFITP